MEVEGTMSLSPEQAVYLAERLGVDPVTAVIDQYRRDGGDSTELTGALSDMRCQLPLSSPGNQVPCVGEAPVQTAQVEKLKEENERLQRLLQETDKTFKDVGVQFTYLLPMIVRGVHVVGERLFEISGDFPQLLEFEGYGLRIQVPEGATSEPCDIAIKSIVAGRFEFPEGTDLVSAVYAISVSKKLAKPVMLEIQHCAAITREEQGRFLSFVRAQCNQPQLPYQFELLDNAGTFPPRPGYGMIEFDQFLLPECDRYSLIAIVCSNVPFPHTAASRYLLRDIRTPPLEYALSVYHTNLAKNSWVWHFNVTKRTDSNMQNSQQSHGSWNTYIHLPFEYSKTKTEFELELDREYTHKGWSILPTVYPCTFHKHIADGWNCSIPYCCSVNVIACEGPDTASYLNYLVRLKGIAGEERRISICETLQNRDPIVQLASVPDHDRSAMLMQLQKRPRISDLLNQVAAKASDKWEILGLHLGINYDQLKTIATENQDNLTCYVEIFEQWKKNGTPPYTWATIIDALREPSVDKVDLAMELEQWVDVTT